MNSKSSKRRTCQLRRSSFLKLPTEVGASCVDYLPIQEQCCLKRVSPTFRSFTRCALSRVHKNAFIVVRTSQPQRSQLNDVEHLKESTAATLRMLQAVSTACPRIQRLHFVEIEDGIKLDAKPVEFTFRMPRYCTRVRASCLRSLPSAKHLVHVDLQLGHTVPSPQVMEDTIVHLSSLRTLSISGSPWTHGSDTFFGNLATACNRVPTVHLKMRLIAHADISEGTFARALGQWKTLRSVDFTLPSGRFLTCNEKHPLYRTVVNLVPSLPGTLQRVRFRMHTFGPTHGIQPPSLILKRLSRSIKARFPTWSGKTFRMTLFLDGRNESPVEVTLDERMNLFFKGADGKRMGLREETEWRMVNFGRVTHALNNLKQLHLIMFQRDEVHTS